MKPNENRKSNFGIKAKGLAVKLLYPQTSAAVSLSAVSAVFLAYALLCLPDSSPLAVTAYSFSAYALTIWCLKLSKLAPVVKRFTAKNKAASKWLGNTSLRMRSSLLCSAVWNSAYAVMQLVLGCFYKTFWFTSFAVYYFLLAVMRGVLYRCLKQESVGDNRMAELKCCGSCGVMLLLMNSALSAVVFYMVYRERTFYRGEIMTITMATYTFLSFTLAVVNYCKYKKLKSPVFSVSKAISLVSACVSLLTLETTMLTTFDNGEMTDQTRKLLLTFTGIAVLAFVTFMALRIAFLAKREIKSSAKNTLSFPKS